MKVAIYSLFHVFSLLVSSGAEPRGRSDTVLTPQHNDQEHRSLMLGQIVSVALIDADTDRKVQNLQNGTIVAKTGYLFSSPNATLNLNVTVNGTDIKSIRFGYSNSATNISSLNVENVAPWAFCANNGTDFYSCPQLGLGTHTITFTPYYQKNARGPPGIAVTMTFTIVAQDLVLPQLLNFTVEPQQKGIITVNVTEGPVRLNGYVTGFDNVSGVLGGTVHLRNLGIDTNIYGIKAAFRGTGTDLGDSIPANPGTATFPYSIIVNRYFTSGYYALDLTMYDTAGNYLFVPNSELSNPGLFYGVYIENSGAFDITPPELVSLTALTPLVVNVTSGPGVVVFEIVVRDDLAGFAFGRATLTSPSRRRQNLIFANRHTDPGEDVFYPAGMNHTFKISGFQFPQGSPTGNYSLSLTLFDDVFRFLSVSTATLAQRGFPSYVTVVS